jgi:RNA polymerase sigma factor (sigma-70 family)
MSAYDKDKLLLKTHLHLGVHWKDVKDEDKRDRNRALSYVIEKVQPKFYSLAFKITGGQIGGAEDRFEESVKDIIIEVVTKIAAGELLQNAETKPDSMINYLANTICKNKFIDLLRKPYIKSEIELPPIEIETEGNDETEIQTSNQQGNNVEWSESPTYSQETNEGILQYHLNNCVKLLTERNQFVCECLKNGWTQVEISEEMNITTQAVNNRLNTIRINISNCINTKITQIGLDIF